MSSSRALYDGFVMCSSLPCLTIPQWWLQRELQKAEQQGGAAADDEADLSVFRGHEVHRVASNATLTFEHTYTWWGVAQPSAELTLVVVR